MLNPSVKRSAQTPKDGAPLARHAYLIVCHPTDGGVINRYGKRSDYPTEKSFSLLAYIMLHCNISLWAMKPLHLFLSLLEELREIDPEMPLQMAATFILVASSPGITMKDLSPKLGFSQASCSRNIAALSKVHRLNKPGHGLVYAIEDPAERRRKIVNLTPRGEKVAARLREIVDTYTDTRVREELKSRLRALVDND